METCGVCGKQVASIVCRRCKRLICDRCHFHHGLCKPCARIIGRLK